MIHGDMLILDILQQYPQAKKVFARYGMPCDRCMGAVHGSLADGARMHGMPLGILIQELEESIATDVRGRGPRLRSQGRDEGLE